MGRGWICTGHEAVGGWKLPVASEQRRGHESDWFYLAIQEATNSHDFVTKDRVYESWTDLNRAPDWSRYE